MSVLADEASSVGFLPVRPKSHRDIALFLHVPVGRVLPGLFLLLFLPLAALLGLLVFLFVHTSGFKQVKKSS